ncbi:MAG: DUF2807 domain-containing protein [Sphingomonas bacterium]|nr:DUF2807 domain-containing protein [Sphingomonas bacterium]
MKKWIPLIAVGALASSCNLFNRAEARDAGATVDRTFQVGAFDKIAVSGPYEVTVKTGAAPGVVAHGGSNFLDQTEIIVENGTLKIRPREKNIKWLWSSDDSKIRIAVSAAALREAAIAGSGGLSIDRVTGGDFKGAVAGSGTLSVVAMDAVSAAFAVAGSGDVNAAGKAQKVDISIAGSGDIDVSELKATDTSVSIAGSGNVRAHASGTADVSIMGSGDVELTGGAKCNVSKNGSGDVRCS